MEDNEDEGEVDEEAARQQHLRRKGFHSQKAMKEIHPNMMESVWDLGIKKQKESNVLVVWSAVEHISKKKKELRAAIVKNIIKINETAENVALD